MLLLTLLDIIVYIFLCCVLFAWLTVKRRQCEKTGIIVLIDVLNGVCVCACCIFITFGTMLCVSNDTDTEDEKSVGNVYEVLTEDVAMVQQQSCFVLKDEYYTSSTGVVCCSVYIDNVLNYELLIDDIVIPLDFCDFVEVIRDEAAENKYNVLFSGFKAEKGDYVINIRNTECSFTIHITDELSDRITMSCSYSDAEIKAGDTVNLLLEYRGLDITNSTGQMQYSDNMVLLRNCVGKVTSVLRENNTVCVTIENIGILDMNKAVTIEIAAGTMLDSTGLMVNGAVVELKIQES